MDDRWTFKIITTDGETEDMYRFRTRAEAEAWIENIRAREYVQSAEIVKLSSGDAPNK